MSFLENKILEVNIRSYLKEAVDDFSKEDLRSIKSLAKQSLFNADMNSLPVSEEDRVKFHSILMKLMYMSYRARKDMKLTTTFLASRVNCCTDQDYSKLWRLICYKIELIDLLMYPGMSDIGVNSSFHRCIFCM